MGWFVLWDRWLGRSIGALATSSLGGLVELEDAFAVAVDVGDDGGEHEEEDAE